MHTSIVIFYTPARVPKMQCQCMRRLLRVETARTSFCAEKMEFMMGMYEEERSGETERMRMRGEAWVAGSSGAVAPAGTCVMRLMSGVRSDQAEREKVQLTA